MSSIQATPEETTQFLSVLEKICRRQRTISEQLDELTLLMQMPSESTLTVLERLLLPMGVTMKALTGSLEDQLVPDQFTGSLSKKV
ncbi:hypothetical protein UM91_18370 [Pseudomonas oryzihabitans]|jgi:hypothetical protein|nr:hypothetical protein UM91_18370 [Pseudomonas oryzihabitans]